MASGGYRFDRFRLDPEDRTLTRDGVPVELNARYLDALILLVREQGRLVTKDRFLDEVWRGVPVTDEALTQCVRTLRARLGDSATSPRFIETAPKHGYRFIAPVSRDGEAEAGRDAPGRKADWGGRLWLAGAAAAGGGFAGMLGGLFYGLAGVSEAAGPGMGATSVVTVLIILTLVIGLVGGAAVGLGVALAGRDGRPGPWGILGGAVAGMIVGGLARLVGSDAFSLLFGQPPGDITGAGEGIVLGAAVGLGAWIAGLAGERLSLRIGVASGGLAGLAAGAAIALMGGRLMAGSLAELAQRFPQSRLDLDQMGGVAGEAGFGPVTQVAVGAVEGLLFVACVVGAMVLAGRRGR
ncbi:transcriptional regulator [Brevundimonas sp.]|uniref:winged helix-turn-helix domain-containing protein n=1 Tax=Brevundimonas sp. TaxID=1871086 RepID=UPI0025FDE540|nr:transcriptional regulator [Brevundimonas sp.]